MVEKSNKTWQAPPRVGTMPTLPGVPDPGGTLKLEHAPEPGGTPERGDEAQPGGALEFRDVREPGGTVELGDASEMGGNDDFMSAQTTPLPVSEERIPDHNRAGSSGRGQGPRDRDEIREGVMRMETRAINQETAPGLTSLIELDGGSRALHAPTGRESSRS